MGANGQIDMGAAVAEVNGIACPHLTSFDASTGGLTIRVMPFEVSQWLCDDFGFRLYVVPEGEFWYQDPDPIFVPVQFPHQPHCADGIVDPGEECDDDNLTDGDGCDAICELEQTGGPVCGNGVQEAGEACDDGNANHNDGCAPTCEVEHLCCCGNGVSEPGEACDDGNHDDGDGCSSTCQAE